MSRPRPSLIEPPINPPPVRWYDEPLVAAMGALALFVAIAFATWVSHAVH